MKWLTDKDLILFEETRLGEGFDDIKAMRLAA